MDKSTALIEIIVMLSVAAFLGFIIGYILQKLQKDKLKSELRFNDDKHLILNNRFDELEKENRELEKLIGNLRNRKSNILTELDDIKKENETLKKEVSTKSNSKDDAEIKSLNAYIARLKKDKEDLKAKYSQENTSSNTDALEAVIDQLKTDKENLEQENQQNAKIATKATEGFEEVINQLKTDKEKLEQENQQNAEISKKATEAFKEVINQLKLDKAKLEQESKHNSEIASKAASALRELEVNQRAILNDKNEAKNEEVKSLNAYISRLKKDKEDLKNQLKKDASKNSSALEAEIKQLKLDKESLEKSLGKLNVKPETSKTGEVRKIESSKSLSIEAFNIKKLALFQSIGEAKESGKNSLTEINGIGPLIEAKLNTIGIYTFKQIASFSEKDIANVTDLIEFFPGRIDRDNWVEQAKNLISAKP